jgi:hypothetical protein
MITFNEERLQQPCEIKDLAGMGHALSPQARRALRAAAAIERGEVDLEHATRRYGIAASLIEAWQHALKTVPHGAGEAEPKMRSTN